MAASPAAGSILFLLCWGWAERRDCHVTSRMSTLASPPLAVSVKEVGLLLLLSDDTGVPRVHVQWW